MKKYYKLILLVMISFVLTGCVDQEEIEEKYRMCIADYIERSGFDLTFEVNDSYETAADTYQEIIQLAFWYQAKEKEFETVFNYWSIKYDDIAKTYIEKEKLYWQDVEKYFAEETAIYQTALEETKNNYLREILNASVEEIKNLQGEIYDELQGSSFKYIRAAEVYREDGNYGEVFLKAREVDVISDMYYELYPEEFYQAALDCIYEDTSLYGINEAKEFFIEIGEYEKYADDIEYAHYWVFEAWRCDNGTCKEWGGFTVKGHSGEYCSIHAKTIENGGPYTEKKRLPFKRDDKEEYSGNLGGPDLGDSDEDVESTPNKTPSSDKTDEDKTQRPSDPYDVYDYDDPEDFYYDWEDDFDGYEDAEDYWYDAWDEVD